MSQINIVTGISLQNHNFPKEIVYLKETCEFVKGTLEDANFFQRVDSGKM